jgi:hypothetical protein
MDPTVGTCAGFIVEPIDVLTMEDIMGDIDLTPMEDIILTPMEAMGEAMEAMEATEDIPTASDNILVRFRVGMVISGAKTV